MTENMVDTEAALEEGLAPMPVDLIPLRNEYRALKEEIDSLNERRDEIKDTFGRALEEAGLQGFILNGKVHARRSSVTNTRTDTKKLKEQMPHIWQKFLVITKSVRVTIN